MRWAGYMARMGEKEKSYRVCVGNLRRLGRHSLYERIILKWNLKKYDGIA
jgi:hypothetical protein